MKNILYVLALIISFDAFAKINRCEMYNEEICQNLTREWGARPNLSLIYFTKAIIEKESGWSDNSSRTEPDGKTSYGLMHIQYETAQEIGLTSSAKSLLRPEVGLKFGIKYMSKKIKLAVSEAKKGRHSVWEIAAASYNRGSIGYRKDGTLISNRDSIGNGKYLTYEEAVINLSRSFMNQCSDWTIEQICQ